MSFAIVPLHERPEFADTCAAWSFGEWGCHSGASLDKTVARYRKTAEGFDLPATWICIDGNKLAGMISLKMDDHPDHPEFSPWLASLFVHPEYRGQGLARKLIAVVEMEATARFKAKEIYLFTAHAETLYKRQGYQHVQRVRDPSGLHADGDLLMKKELTHV